MSELALFGGRKAKGKPFPDWPMYDDKERRALMEVLESRIWWRTPGTKTPEFEREFAAFHGARHGVAVTNGTAAIEVESRPPLIQTPTLLVRRRSPTACQKRVLKCST